MTLQDVYNDYNDDLRKIIAYYSISEHERIDVANEFYIKVDKGLKNGKGKIMYNGDNINKRYMFTIVKNVIMEYKSKHWTSTIPIESVELSYTPQEPSHRMELLRIIMKSQGSWFDKRLMYIYMTEDKSIRQLAKETGISKTTIHTSLQRTKEYIKRKFNELGEQTND